MPFIGSLRTNLTLQGHGKNEKLIKMFGPELREHLIFYKPFKKLLFPVNSLTPGKADYDVAKSIQDGVERSVCKKVKVPI